MVSRETGVWSTDRFLRWYKKSVLNSMGAHVGGLSLEPFVLTLLSVSRASDDPVVIVSPNEAVSERLYTVSYGLCLDSSLLLPEPETSKDSVPGFVSEVQRHTEEALSAISSRDRKKRVFTTNRALDTLRSPLVQPSDKGVVVSLNQKMAMAYATQFLDRWGYVKTDRVVSPLSYAVRGGILDVYLVQSRNPVRLEFFGDVVESIRLFNPYSQRTVKPLTEVVFLPRIVGGQTKEEPLLSLVISEGSFCLYNIDVISEGRYQVSSGRAISCDFSLAPESVSKKTIKKMVLGKKDVSFFSFSTDPASAQTPAFLPPGHSTQRVRGELEKGFVLADAGLVVFGSEELSGPRYSVRSRWSVVGDPAEQHNEIIDMSDLTWGEPIVHEEFGIGIYRGIEKTGGNDCIKIKYADGGSVFVPVYSFNKLHRLVGVKEDSVRVASLSGGAWKRKKDKIKTHARSVAKELLKTYALRQGSRGFIYEKGGDFYKAVCDSFPFQETIGQQSAIRDVATDMEKDVPMDRMVCGDVGYGKTEVAIRATIRLSLIHI